MCRMGWQVQECHGCKVNGRGMGKGRQAWHQVAAPHVPHPSLCLALHAGIGSRQGREGLIENVECEDFDRVLQASAQLLLHFMLLVSSLLLCFSAGAIASKFQAGAGCGNTMQHHIANSLAHINASHCAPPIPFLLCCPFHQINLRGSLLGTKYAARAMKAKETRGCIINTASIAGLRPNLTSFGAPIYLPAGGSLLPLFVEIKEMRQTTGGKTGGVSNR